MIKKCKRIISGALAVTLCVAMNINPLATIAGAIVESGIIDKASTIGKNLAYIADGYPENVYASGQTVDSVVVNCSCDHEDYSNILERINGNLEYEDGSQLDTIRRDITVIRGYNKELVELSESIDQTTKAILQDTHYIIQQLGYDPTATGVKPKNVRESFEHVSDQLDQISHEYRVANIKSINNMFPGALWKPKFEEVPNLTEYCEITGGFANTYNGYWDTSYDESVESVLPTEKALEELGYDAIIRAEGILPVGVALPLGEGTDKAEVTLAMPYDTVTGGSGMSTSNEVLVYDSEGNLDVVYNDWGQITDSYNISDSIPTSQMIKLEQITIPSSNITYLDAVTVLYKALGEDIVTLEGLYTRNPDLEVESSPLAKGLPGVVDNWQGYDYYVFATRANPITYEIQGDNSLIRYEYSYWKKAVSAGFVNYNLRDEPISAVDFCTLASKMMTAYGEPELTDDELHTLLQVYGSYYPIQMGENIALSWAYLKARGILTEDNFPDIYTETISRDQLLDMCARIKNPDLRATYKNIELAITLDDVVVDKGVYPYYNFAIDRGGEMFLETTIDYTTLNHYTYLFPMTTDGDKSVNLGYGGAGFVFTSTDYTTLVEGAMYNGMIKLMDDTGGHYYYVVQIPKDYKGNAYLRFVDVNDQERDLGTVASIEFNPSWMCGGIFTQYEFNDVNGKRVATLCDVEEGVNWFSFSTQPNNMDLIWFGDKIRCNAEEEEPELQTAALTTTANPTALESLEVFWNKLTTPMVVKAAENGTTPVSEAKWSFDSDITDVNGGSSLLGYLKDSDGNSVDLKGYYLIDQDSYTDSTGVNYIYSDNKSAIQRAVHSKAVTLVCRAALCSDYKISDAIDKYHADMTKTNPKHSGGDGLQNLLTLSLSDRAKFKDFVGDANTYYTDEYFPALYYLGANGAKNIPGTSPSVQPQTPLNPNLTNNETIRSLRTVESNPGLMDTVDKVLNNIYTLDNGFDCSPISVDGKVVASGDKSSVQLFNQSIANFLSDDNFNSTGTVGLKDVRLDTTLETSVLMSRQNQIYVAWTEMVKYGIAKDIDEDGKPTLSKSDGVYEFYTHNGVVRVDDVNKIIQIGTQIYSFNYPNDLDPPALVQSNSDGTEIYFDIRCITGVSNGDGYTLDAGKASRQELVIGAGDYSILCLSGSGSSNSGSMKTKRAPVVPYAEQSEINAGTLASNEMKVEVIERTIYDSSPAVNNVVGSNTTATKPFIYWKNANGTDDVNDDTQIDNATRITMANTIPIANWLFTTTDDGTAFGGKLYVFYLKQAFTEGFYSARAGTTVTMPEPKKAHIDEWSGVLYSDAIQTIASRYPTMQFEKYFNEWYGTDTHPWAVQMTKCALANLAADTGVLWSDEQYYVRVFDFTNSSAANNTYETDFTKDSLEVTDNPSTSKVDEAVERSNQPGAMYFLDFLGYVYNMPLMQNFDLMDYYTGKYPLPLATSSAEVIDYNFNYYGTTNIAYGEQVDIPLGIDLTSYGFVKYGCDSNGAIIKAPNAVYENLKENKFKLKDVYDPPFTVGTDNEGNVGSGIGEGSFCAAPSGVYMRYGLFRDTDYDKKISDISQSMTDLNDFYIGSRRVVMSDNNSPTNEMRYWNYASKDYGPIGISASFYAELCHKYMDNWSKGYTTNAYVINTNAIKTPFFIATGDVITLGVQTPEIDWDGRAKLVSILDAIDQGTKWWVWCCLTIAPILCLILMTILIGLSFITESKIWLAFCDKFFDPVRLLTFGARDSHRWNWRRVLIPCLITYIAFALLCNANILKIIIWVVDAWMRLMSAI